MKKIQIKEPCKQTWEDMQDVADGRFCDTCQKKVWDLDRLHEQEIAKILRHNPSICGKTSFLKPTFSSIFLALTLTSATYTYAQTSNQSSVENIYHKDITITGKLDSINDTLINTAEISLVTLEKLFRAKADDQGNFTLTFPEKALTEYNVIRIDYTFKDSMNKEVTDSNTSILKTNELMAKQNFEIEKRYVTIGAVVITKPQPPDYYFFDGKKIGKRKFEKIKTEHPEYKYIAVYDEAAKRKLTNKSFIDNLYLLYSR